MRTDLVTALAIAAGLVLGGAAQAQQPAPVAAPPPPEYGLPINNEQAKAAANAAIEAAKGKFRMAIAIVGPDGELIYFEKMDGTQNASVKIAQGKARTSALFRRASKAFAVQYAAGNTAFLTFPEQPVASEGGMPIIIGGKIAGAIGVSGGTGQQDGIVAMAGASAVK